MQPATEPSGTQLSGRFPSTKVRCRITVPPCLKIPPPPAGAFETLMITVSLVRVSVLPR